MAAEAQARAAIDRAFAELNGEEDEHESVVDDASEAGEEGDEGAAIQEFEAGWVEAEDARVHPATGDCEAEEEASGMAVRTNELFEREGGGDAVGDGADEAGTSAQAERLQHMRSVWESASWRGAMGAKASRATHARPSAGWTRAHGRAMARLAAASERLRSWHPLTVGLGSGVDQVEGGCRSVAAAAAEAALRARRGAEERAARAEERCRELAGRLQAAEARAQRASQRAGGTAAFEAGAEGRRTVRETDGARRRGGGRSVRADVRKALSAMLLEGGDGDDDDCDGDD